VWRVWGLRMDAESTYLVRDRLWHVRFFISWEKIFITAQYEIGIFDVVILSGPFCRIPQILITIVVLLGFLKSSRLQDKAHAVEESKANNIAAVNRITEVTNISVVMKRVWALRARISTGLFCPLFSYCVVGLVPAIHSKGNKKMWKFCSEL
jgi:hypothetical protein